MGDEPVVFSNLITFISAGIVFFASAGVFHLTSEQTELTTVVITSTVHLLMTIFARSRVTPIDKIQ